MIFEQISTKLIEKSTKLLKIEIKNSQNVFQTTSRAKKQMFHNISLTLERTS